MKKLVYLFAIILFSLFACEKVVYIKIPQKDPKLVVNAELAKDSLIILGVGKSRHVLDNVYSSPSYIEEFMVSNATPVIYENGIAIDTLVYVASDYQYKSMRNKKILLGNTYSIKVTAPGFKDVTAESIVPTQSVIAEVNRIKNARTNSNGEQVDEITIKLNDPAEVNFYLIRFYTASYSSYGGSYTIGCVSTTDKDIETTGDESDPTAEDNCYDGGNLLMKDINFNNRQKQLKFSIESNQLTEYYNNGRMYRPYVKVYRITEAYFKFLKSRAIYDGANDNPFAEPANVYTNIKDGYGIFSAYTVATDTLR
jgi:hypothetical protein